MPQLQFSLGQRLRIYVMALGTEVDMHTPNLQHAAMHAANRDHTLPALSMVPGKRVLGSFGQAG